MRRSAFLLAITALVAVPSLRTLAGRATPASQPSAAVRGALERVEREPADRQLQTLDEAARAAEQSRDTAGALAVADAAHNLGGRYYQGHELALARECYQRAVRLRESREAGSFNLAADLNNLANVVSDQGDLAEAEKLYRRSLAIKERVEAAESPSIANTLNNLGNVAFRRNDFTAARDFYERALAIKERATPNSLTLVNTLNNLGIVTARQGDGKLSEQFYQRALAIQGRLNAPPSTVASTFNNLGNAARGRGDLAAARDFYQRALAIQEREPAQSIGRAETLNNLGLLMSQLGDAAGAATHLGNALRILEQQAPASDRTATVLINLARVHLASKSFTEAGEDLRRAEEIWDALRSVPKDPDATVPADTVPAGVMPEVRFLSPADNSVVEGHQVALSMALVAPLSPVRYRVQINGRPVGPEEGFPLPPAPGDADRRLEKGRILQRGADRDALAGEVPPEVARLVRMPENAHYQQVRHTFRVEESDGTVLRIAVALETAGGSVGTYTLQLRRPGAMPAGALRVLTVGVGNYPRLPKLRFAADDARDLAAALKSQGGAGRIYQSAQAEILTEEQATLPAIRQALDRLTRDVQPGETLILFLSGHGLKDGQKFYFAPVGMDAAKMDGTGLAWEEVLRRLEVARRRARAVWVLADCCRAGPGLNERRLTGKDLRRGTPEGGNLVICSASSGDSPSYEAESLKHGLFTQAWLDVLRGEAPGAVYRDIPPGRVLTLLPLLVAVESSVSSYAEREGIQQEVEFPQLRGRFAPRQPVFMAVPRQVGLRGPNE
jgi:tetratricopeptide (TPR) repeat protein